MAETRPVAGYYRVSVARDDMKAPELYQSEIDRYCHFKRLKLQKTFSDIDHSAFRGARRRPALEELKRRRQEFSAVVVPKLSRFGRSVKDLISLFELFESDGIALIFLDVGLDTSSSQGRLLRHIMSAFAEYESDVRADYFRAAIDARARRGLPPGGWIAYGYRRSAGSYAIFEPEAVVVREVFERYGAGESLKGICRGLNARGVSSPKGVTWAYPTIRNFLDNVHYVACFQHGGELLAGNWEPIIARELWEVVQRRRLAVPNRGVTKPTAGLYLLSGLIECGVCGTILHHRTKQDRVPGQYVCRGTENLGFCRGGGIAEHRAEALIVGAYLERYGASLVHDATSAPGPQPVSVHWRSASLEQRRSMLASAIARVVVIPRPPGNPRGTGLPRGRKLEITWAVEATGRDAPVVLGAMLDHGEAKVCVTCGKRKHISNFRVDPSQESGRSASCGRCRQDQLPVPALPAITGKRMSYQQEWRRFQEELRWTREKASRGV